MTTIRNLLSLLVMIAILAAIAFTAPPPSTQASEKPAIVKTAPPGSVTAIALRSVTVRLEIAAAENRFTNSKTTIGNETVLLSRVKASPAIVLLN